MKASTIGARRQALEIRSAPRTFSRTFSRTLPGGGLMVALALGLLGCGDTISLPDQAGSVESVDAIEGAGAQVVVRYTLSDPDGNDQRIKVWVCQQDGSVCGYPLRGAGGDGAVRLPTQADGAPSAHVFVWEVGCGRAVRAQQQSRIVVTELDLQYVVRVALEDRPGEVQQSEPFSLRDDLGFDSLPGCTRAIGTP